MIVEDVRSGSNGGDKFPIGMRVLAVDDDHTCLLILETLLKKCQYQVTATNQAIMAVKMLREDRNKYDLVISDVNMPDMDGFKLLELVGLEMDLPVIMLSAHSDTELVMKGVAHGACDYLLKPVRIKDLRNIWQHVVRRRKLEPKDEDNAGNQDGQPGVGVAGSAATDQNGTKKRKDQNGEDEDNELGNKDPSTQKKPRVVWTQELHCNFVAAVHQLGLGKAFPKKILDVMNVEGLTRENVASHLQKYRQYLKKAVQQGNMVPLPGMRDISYPRVGGSGDFRTFNGARRFSSTISSSHQAGGNGMLDRLNSTAAAFRRLAISPSTITSQAATNSMHTLQPAGVPASQNHGVNLVNQLSQSSSYVQEMNTNVNGSAAFRAALCGPDSSSSMLDPGSGVAYGNQAFLGLVSLQQEPIDIRVQGSSNFHDENWTNSKFPTNSLRMIEATGLESSTFQDNLPWSSSQLGNAAVDISSSMGHPEIVGQNQAGLSSNLVHGIGQWEDHHCQNASNSFTMASQGTMMGQNSAFGKNTTNAQLLGGDSPLIVQQIQGERSVLDPKLSSNFSHGLDQQKEQSGFIQNNYTSLDDIMGTIIKPGQIHDSAMIDVEFGFDGYSLGLK